MNQPRSVFWKNAATHGFIVGAVFVLLAVATWLGELEKARFMWWINMLFSIGAVYFVMKTWRDRFLGGLIKYSQALAYGVAVMFLASIVFGFYNVIYMNYLDPESIQRTLGMLEESYYEMGFSEDRIDMMMDMAETMQTPFMQASSAVLGLTFRGFLISLITALFVRKEGDPFQTAMKDVD